MSAFLKFLSPLVHPVGLAWLLLLLAAGICARRGRRLGTFVTLGLAAMLWLLCQPVLMEPLYVGLERPWRDHTVEQATNADAVVVLGGGWRLSGLEYGGLDLTDAADRLATGLELCRLGRARTLVVGGDMAGRAPGSVTESDHLRRWIQNWGMTNTELVSLGPVRTTADEAAGARKLAEERGWKQVLLVTSAFHMRRAKATFEGAGVPVQPVACDFRFELYGPASRSWALFPNEEAVNQFGIWWHEQLGVVVYRALGRAR